MGTEKTGPELVHTLELAARYDSELPRALGRDDTEHSALERHVNSKFSSPYDWSDTRKATIVAICLVAPLLASCASSGYEPCKEQLMEQWGASALVVAVGMTTFLAGFAIGPMFLAPFSETLGRKPVFVITGVMFVASQIGCAASKTPAGMFVARFFAGVGSSTYSTLIGGVIADMYRSADRNTPMALFACGGVSGVGFGPMICGFIVQYTHWSWVFYSQAIADAALVVAFLIWVPETREGIILAKKAAYLHSHYTGLKAECEAIEFEIEARQAVERDITEMLSPVRAKHVHWSSGETKSGAERKSIWSMLATSLLRPFELLFTEPVVFFFSLWATFSWGVLFLNVSAVSEMFIKVYGFSLSQADATFASSCVGTFISALAAVYFDKFMSRRTPADSDSEDGTATPPQKGKIALDNSPERRLYLSSVVSLLLPVGLFIFGWTARESVHWIVPTIALGLATAGIYSVYLAVFNYLVDAYMTYASSALAAQSFCRNVVAGVLPLVSAQMYDGMGYGPASSMLGAIGLALTGVCWVLILYGPQIRSKSRVARKLREADML